MRILILDDDDTRHRKFNRRLIGNYVVNTYTANECIEQLNENGPWEYCFLDHDLGGQIFQASTKGTGWEVAKWISENKSKKPMYVIVHSFNYNGAKLMTDLIEGSKHIPGVWDRINLETK